jgi:ribosomal protein S17
MTPEQKAINILIKQRAESDYKVIQYRKYIKKLKKLYIRDISQMTVWQGIKILINIIKFKIYGRCF